MVRSILTVFDGSPYSDHLVNLGIRWARESNALLVGLGIVDEALVAHPEAVSIGAAYFKQESDEAKLMHARHHVEQLLEQFTLACVEAQVPSKLLEEEGAPYEQIVREAQRYDLIMLSLEAPDETGTHGRLGHTLVHILQQTPRPVVAVPAHVPSGGSVLIAYDGSLQAARALHAFVAAELHRKQPVHVLTVSADRVEGARCADRAVEFLRSHDIDAQPQVLAPTDVLDHLILDQTIQCDASLVVMGAFGQPKWREFVLGSTTRSVLEKTHVPVFLFH